MNTLHPIETLTLDNLNINWELINLNPEKIELLNYLEKETKLSKESFLNKIINGKSEWIDLEDLKYSLEWEKKPNKVFLNKEESDEYLNNLFLTNHPRDYKQSHDLQL